MQMGDFVNLDSSRKLKRRGKLERWGFTQAFAYQDLQVFFKFPTNSKSEFDEVIKFKGHRTIIARFALQFI